MSEISHFAEFLFKRSQRCVHTDKEAHIDEILHFG